MELYHAWRIFVVVNAFQFCWEYNQSVRHSYGNFRGNLARNFSNQQTKNNKIKLFQFIKFHFKYETKPFSLTSLNRPRKSRPLKYGFTHHRRCCRLFLRFKLSAIMSRIAVDATVKKSSSILNFIELNLAKTMNNVQTTFLIHLAKQTIWQIVTKCWLYWSHYTSTCFWYNERSCQSTHMY